MPLKPQTLELLAQSEFADDELIAGGPAQCRALDRDFMQALEAANGGFEGVKGMAKANGINFARFLDSDWAATDQRLLYVRPHARAFNSWRWSEIVSLSIVGVTYLGLFRKVRLSTTEGRQYDFSINRQATAALLHIARERLSSGP